MPRRLAFTGAYAADLLDYEPPPLEPEQLRVRTAWASGKIGTTAAIFDSRAFRDKRFDPNLRIFLDDPGNSTVPTPENPSNSGTTGVGVVEEVGAAVTRFKPGDTVFGYMDIREVNVCNQARTFHLGALDPMTALCIEPAYVAFHCVRESNVRFGESVVVIGLGALGLLAVKLAHESGAETVIAVDPVAARRDLAIQYGATAVLDPRAQDTGLEVHALTGSKGADVAIELSGVYPALTDAIRSVRVAGTVCSAGFYQGDAQGVWLGREFHHNRLTMVVPHGCGWGHPPRDYPRWDGDRAYAAIASLMHQGRLDVPGLVNAQIAFEDTPRLFDWLKEQDGGVIKFAVKF
jgi:threonine dehydrogenase-like Zn-dependent dehydrogenase